MPLLLSDTRGVRHFEGTGVQTEVAPPVPRSNGHGRRHSAGLPLPAQAHAREGARFPGRAPIHISDRLDFNPV